jgi:hypothetical protein
MGSVLELNGDVVWPGPVLSLLFSYKDMDKLLDPNLKATNIIRKFSISTQYQSLIDDLAQCDFREDDNPKTLFVCPYDWRKDNASSADTLANKIDEAFALHGAGTEISIIAHSMGGLVSRYYLESGAYAARPGFSSMRRLLTLGTPHRGSPLALTAALGMEKRLFLSKEQVKLLVNDPRYPSVYQLMPPPDEPFAWNEDKASEYGQVDVYDNQIAQALGLVQQNLQSAQTFQSKLDINKRPKYNGKPIRYFFFVGTRQKTNSVATLLQIQNNPVRYRVLRSELEDAGDGTVPAWSGGITGVQNQPVGGEHSTIYRNDTLRRTMGILLGKPGVLAGVPEHVEVALRERVVNPNDRVYLTLSFANGVEILKGELRVQRAVLNQQTGEVESFANPISVFHINYTGLNAEKLSVIFNAPSSPSIYRVAYYPDGYDEPAGSDELFVQLL